ncbi:hypothetical protein [Streptomyces sp. NRRL S-350]|uniref:hypothetical protein n=1 Tax=Streptomyces sp. NRRL S-350 TaxID=1463902 RepID=UPI0004C22F91|nr:hypothetical protein [Streptomyces sp. NRRL S-350]
MLSCRAFACTAAASIALACGALAGTAQAATGLPPVAGPVATASVPAAPGTLAGDVTALLPTKVPAINTPGDWRWE